MRRTITALAAASALAFTATAAAVPPGADGLIAYDSSDGVTLIRGDGTGKVGLGDDTGSPVGWSPDGRRLAFVQVDSETEEPSLAVQDIVTGQRTLLDFPQDSETERISLGDAQWSRDGRTILTAGVRRTSDPETESTTREAVMLEWPIITTGADPVVTHVGPEGLQPRFFDVSPRDASLAIVHRVEDDVESVERLFAAPLSDPFGGLLLRESRLAGTSYAPDGSAVLTWDSAGTIVDGEPDRAIVRIPSGGGAPVPVLDGSQVFLARTQEYTPAGRGIAILADHETVLDSVYTFSAAGPPGQTPVKIPNTDDARASNFLAVQPILASSLDVDPVLLRLSPLRLGILSFSARLSDRFGPVGGAPVKFTTKSGAPGCTATTNAQGVAKCSVTMPWLQAALSLGVNAAYAGDATHTGATGSAGLIK